MFAHHSHMLLAAFVFKDVRKSQQKNGENRSRYAQKWQQSWAQMDTVGRDSVLA